MKEKIILILCGILLMTAPAFAEYRIPDTGQTKCYDDKENEINPCPKPGEQFYGQDGNYSINPMSFTKLDEQGNDLPDSAKIWAMVRDNSTGLIWEMKTDDDSVHDKDNKYTWEEALKVLEKLNAEKFGGYSDWRLPAREELRSIVNYGKYNPAIDTAYFPNTVSSFYRASETLAWDSGSAWGDDFGSGNGTYDAKSESWHVRAVRGGRSRLFGNSDYLVINNDKTVTDKRTNLMWQQEEAGKMTWENALNYCENLNLAGYDDWRLPTIKELASLPMLDRYNPALDQKYFPNVHSDKYYRTSTSLSWYSGSAWGVYLFYGDDYFYAKSESWYVRAVRGGQPGSLSSKEPEKSEPQRPAIDKVLSSLEDSLTKLKKLKETEPQRPFLHKETRTEPPKVNPIGDYYALIIGNNSYKYFPPLKTAIQDAKDVADVLKNQYNFQIKLLLNATYKEILDALNEYRKILKENDSLLIYYAGHGIFDKEAEKAYWLPVNADSSNNTEWIIADIITANIKRTSSEHILIVSDSCYSGTLTRTGEINLKSGAERERYLRKMMQKKSRTLIASGGDEPVKDEGGKGHSIFAQAFIDGLKEMESNVFLAEELFYKHIKEPVAGNASQVPEYHIIRDSGHNGGDFVFMRRK